jgi:hypothetical protein
MLKRARSAKTFVRDDDVDDQTTALTNVRPGGGTSRARSVRRPAILLPTARHRRAPPSAIGISRATIGAPKPGAVVRSGLGGLSRPPSGRAATLSPMRVLVEGLPHGPLEVDSDRSPDNEPPLEMTLGPMVFAGWSTPNAERITATFVGVHGGVAVYLVATR